MEGEQPPCHSSRRAHSALSLALTVLGLALIEAALAAPGAPPPAATPVAAVSRQGAASASARGQRVAGRQWTQAEESALSIESEATAQTWQAPASWPSLGTGGPEEDVVLSVPAPTPTPPRTEVIVYTVQPGDNVWLIAQRFGISQDTVIWANDWLDMDPDLVRIGEELYILPVTGVWHTVRPGETLASIARRYQVDPKQIVDYAPNLLQEPADLAPGQKLIVPGGIRPFEPRLVRTEGGVVTLNAPLEPGRFIWPCNGATTDYFRPQHLAIDIANAEGTPIYAADSGTVAHAGMYGTMGLAVHIAHGNGYDTWYGHLRAYSVQVGQYVQRGQQIGEMGSTGKSTGPHLHFMIIYQGGAVNPARYLPRP